MLTIQPAHLTADIRTVSGAAQFIDQLGDPVPLNMASVSGAILAAFTPSATGVTLAVDSNALSWVNANVRAAQLIGAGFAAVNHLRFFVRRKPGTTGAIAAQSILLEGWDGAAYVRIGKIYVKAAAADAQAEPESDFLDLPFCNGTSEVTFAAAHPFKITFGSADADLEAVLKVWGEDAD